MHDVAALVRKATQMDLVSYGDHSDCKGFSSNFLGGMGLHIKTLRISSIAFRFQAERAAASTVVFGKPKRPLQLDEMKRKMVLCQGSTTLRHLGEELGKGLLPFGLKI